MKKKGIFYLRKVRQVKFLEYIWEKYGIENVILTGEIEGTKTMHSLLRGLQEMDGGNGV